MSGWRPAYTLDEDRKILRYIIDGSYGRSVKGDGLWKNMEQEDIAPGRTWQSMKNRWAKNISVDLGRPEYGITQEERTMLKADMAVGGKVAGLKPKDELVEGQKEEEVHEPNLARKDKEFYSLDMNWSDDDTD